MSDYKVRMCVGFEIVSELIAEYPKTPKPQSMDVEIIFARNEREFQAESGCKKSS